MAGLFDRLFEPGRIGPAVLPNRLVMPSMTTRTADQDGTVTEDSLAYYRARAEGGVGLVTVEMAAPEPVGRHRARELGISADSHIPGLSRLTAAIHQAGAGAMIQLGHGGGHTRADICGETPIAPSAVPHPVFEGTLETVIPQAMSAARIAETTAAFARAAARARDAGFDAVELHGAHGYLISQFLCPAENQRRDHYGGSLENRARFGLEILRAVKDAIPELAVVFRLTVDDFFAGGLKREEGLAVAQWLAEAGADAIHVTAGHYRSRHPAIMIPPMMFPEATFLDIAAAVRARVSVPVVAVGRLGGPHAAAAALEQGKCDFIALGRSLLADPDWPRKVRAGAPVRRCLACNSCVNDMRGGAALRCIVNPTAGRERIYGDPLRQPAPLRERIAVIGAGPAGLAYAGLAARHNQVTVFEREKNAGGALRLAARAPLFQEVETARAAFDVHIDSLVAECRSVGAALRFGIDAEKTPGILAEFDRLVFATGARYRHGAGPLLRGLLRAGIARWPGIRALFRRPRLRDWFYYRARKASGAHMARLARPHQQVTIIGDAAEPGKTAAAVRSAFDAAYGLTASGAEA